MRKLILGVLCVFSMLGALSASAAIGDVGPGLVQQSSDTPPKHPMDGLME